MNMFKKNGGFTLVELIIVIAILAILSSVAVVGYSAYIKRANDAAVLAELSNISSAATMANAKAAGITQITVAANGTITVEAESFDGDTYGFVYLFNASTNIELTPSGDDFVSAAGKVTLTNSKYAAGATWTPAAGWVPAT